MFLDHLPYSIHRTTVVQAVDRRGVAVQRELAEEPEGVRTDKRSRPRSWRTSRRENTPTRPGASRRRSSSSGKLCCVAAAVLDAAKSNSTSATRPRRLLTNETMWASVSPPLPPWVGYAKHRIENLPYPKKPLGGWRISR